MEENKCYLGDGVYAKEGRWKGQVVVYASDGLVDSNHVFLEANEIERLISFAKEQGVIK